MIVLALAGPGLENGPGSGLGLGLRLVYTYDVDASISALYLSMCLCLQFTPILQAQESETIPILLWWCLYLRRCVVRVNRNDASVSTSTSDTKLKYSHKLSAYIIHTRSYLQNDVRNYVGFFRIYSYIRIYSDLFDRAIWVPSQGCSNLLTLALTSSLWFLFDL